MKLSRIAMLALGAAIVASLVAEPVSAQSKGDDKSMPWTIVAGVNLAGLSGAPAGASYGDKTGILVGVGTSFELSKSLHLAPEALFQMQGFTSGAASVSANYIMIPVNFRFNFESSGESGMSPFLHAGPVVGLRLSCSVSGIAGATCNGLTGKEPKSVDFGLVFGGGLEFKAGTNTIGVGLRYQLGLTDVLDGVSGKNKAIQIVGTWKIK